REQASCDRLRRNQRGDKTDGAKKDHCTPDCWRKSDGSSWWKPAEGFNQVCSFEDARKDGCKRPTVAEQRQRPCYRHARIAPVLQAQIVSFKNQPKGNRKHGGGGKLARLIMQAGVPSDRQYGRVCQQGAASPGNRCEINCDRLEAPKEQPLGDDQSDQSSPAISRQLTLAVAKKFNAQNSRGQKRYRQPKGDHEIMLAHDEDRSRGIMRLRERVVCAIWFHYPFYCL